MIVVAKNFAAGTLATLESPYQPNIKLHIRKPPYILKTAESEAELNAAYRLRAQVFFEESGNSAIADYDRDEFDATCDHILIIDERTGALAGTYRVRSTQFNEDFYSAGEFELGPILQLPGHKLELGRAAVHRDYRNGSVLSMLWRGIANYSVLADCDYLFGCSSVFTTDFLTAARISLHLRKMGALSPEAVTRPTPKYRIRDFAALEAYCEPEYGAAAAQASLPPLFQAYLRMGAKVCGEPAFDAPFNCVDFLTLLELEKLGRMFRRFRD